MARNKLDLGVGKFLNELVPLPGHLGGLAAPIAEDEAEAAAGELRARYPRGKTGRLQDGVRVDDVASNPAWPIKVLRSTTYYARWYEFGTRYTRPHPTFVPVQREYRRRLRAKLILMLQEEGFRVTGSGDIV